MSIVIESTHPLFEVAIKSEINEPLELYECKAGNELILILLPSPKSQFQLLIIAFDDEALKVKLKLLSHEKTVSTNPEIIGVGKIVIGPTVFKSEQLELKAFNFIL